MVCVSDWKSLSQAAEEAKRIAEAEHEQHRTAQRIRANIDKMRKHLESESARLGAALQTDMQKRHDEIRTWCSAFLDCCHVHISLHEMFEDFLLFQVRNCNTLVQRKARNEDQHSKRVCSPYRINSQVWQVHPTNYSISRSKNYSVCSARILPAFPPELGVKDRIRVWRRTESERRNRCARDRTWPGAVVFTRCL